MYKHPALQVIDLINDRLAEIETSGDLEATGNQIEERLKAHLKQFKLLRLKLDLQAFYERRF